LPRLSTPVVDELILLGLGADPAVLPITGCPFVCVGGRVAERIDEGWEGTEAGTTSEIVDGDRRERETAGEPFDRERRSKQEQIRNCNLGGKGKVC